MTFGDYLFLGFLVAVFLGFGHLLAKQDKERQKAYKQGFFDACNCKRPDCHLFYNDNYLAHSPTGDEDFDDLAGYTYPYERTKLYKLGYDSCKFDVDFDLVSGRYVIDAKSIMGIFSLDLSKPINLNVHAEGNNLDEVLKVLAPYIID